MERKIVITDDGSSTIHLPEWDEQYHSKHGAIQEAYHVFIKHGLSYFLDTHVGVEQPISILEIGFGTGLNAFITLLESEKKVTAIRYTGVEAYPVSMDEIKQLNYPTALNVVDKNDLFMLLHRSPWEFAQQVTAHFSITKQQKFFCEINACNKHDLIYFDAFGARVQPELWTEAIFQKMYEALKPNGVLVTYSAKGSARRAMQAVGFMVEKLPGPPGKREMLRAIKGL